MLLIYCPRPTHRIYYTFDLILKDILGTDYALTRNVEDFINCQGAKFSYSHRPVSDNELFFNSTPLLQETGIKEQIVNVFEWNNQKVFFKTNPQSALPFDPFAACFYLVSRYEEYLPHKRDQYDRFAHTESLAYQCNFIKVPLVNKWSLTIKSLIQQRYPAYTFPTRKYNYVSTFDIDCAFAYKEKGFVRTLGGYIKSLTDFNKEELLERTLVLLNKKSDPFDTYPMQLALHKKYNIKPIYFILVGDYDVNDKNISVDSHVFQALIKSLADYAIIGIHPSYVSNRKPEKLEIEISRLSKIIKRDITKSRQHFLKLQLPVTYQRLLDLDIKEDYSMGYANESGFRASICTPFYFYNLDSEKKTDLKVYPFTIMEATLKYYNNLKPEDIISHVMPLVEEVKAVNGTFISIWHNDSLSSTKFWNGWQNIYEEILKISA